MASITIRNLDEIPEIPSAYSGCGSRPLDILLSSLNQEPRNLGTAINALFKPVGYDPPRYQCRARSSNGAAHAKLQKRPEFLLTGVDVGSRVSSGWFWSVYRGR
jgi:hypothetical protein